MSAKTMNVEHSVFDQMMLVEFTDVRLSKDSSYVNTGRIFFEFVMEDKKMKNHAKAFFGNEIVERLLQIPIWERR